MNTSSPQLTRLMQADTDDEIRVIGRTLGLPAWSLPQGRASIRNLASAIEKGTLGQHGYPCECQAAWDKLTPEERARLRQIARKLEI